MTAIAEYDEPRGLALLAAKHRAAKSARDARRQAAKDAKAAEKRQIAAEIQADRDSQAAQRRAKREMKTAEKRRKATEKQAAKDAKAARRRAGRQVNDTRAATGKLYQSRSTESAVQPDESQFPESVEEARRPTESNTLNLEPEWPTAVHGRRELLRDLRYLDDF